VIFSTKFIYEPPKKRNFFPKIYRSILKKLVRIEWFIKSNYNYYLRTKLIRRGIKLHSICIIFPSKERPHNLKRLLESLIKNTNDISRIKVLILLDEDESQYLKYKDIETYYNSINLFVKIFKKNLNSNCERWNYLAYKYQEEDLYLWLNDDAVFILENWDIYIDFVASKIPLNVPYSIWTRSNIHHEKFYYLHSDMPIVNNLWFKTLGYIGNKYLHDMGDAWICELGRLSGNFIITKKFILNHLSINITKDEKKFDNTYLLNEKKKKNDYNLWKITIKNRIEDAKKLKFKYKKHLFVA